MLHEEGTNLGHRVVHSGEALKRKTGLFFAELNEQREQLMSGVRLPHLSYAGLSYIAPALPWLPQQECLKAAFVRGATARAAVRSVEFPAQWLLGPRGSSPKTSRQLEFSTSLAAVQAACNQMLALAGVPNKSNIFLTCSSDHPRFAGRQWQCLLQLAWEDESVALGVFVGPTFPMLSTAVNNTVPWDNKDLQIKMGTANKRMSGSNGARSTRGYRSMFQFSSADACEAPPWAKGDKVVVRVTVFAHNIV
jgi:hypothetical protein